MRPKHTYGVLWTTAWLIWAVGIILSFITPRWRLVSYLIFPPMVLPTGFALTSFGTYRQKGAWILAIFWLVAAAIILGYRIHHHLPVGGLAVLIVCLITLVAGILTSYPEHVKQKREREKTK